MSGSDALSLGDVIRRQRQLQALTLRQFANMVGISNPYLSQIERGLREPSERVVDAIARTLELSADALYEQAGLARATAGTDEAAPAPGARVIDAINADPALNARQRSALIEIYRSFAGDGAGSERRRVRSGPGAGRAAGDD